MDNEKLHKESVTHIVEALDEISHAIDRMNADLTEKLDELPRGSHAIAIESQLEKILEVLKDRLP